MWNAGLDEAQTGIKSTRRNINSLRYIHDITLMAESEEKALKNLLIKVKEESEIVGLKLNIPWLRFMGSQRVGHNWATDLIWSESNCR